VAESPSFGEGKGLKCDIRLKQDISADSMNIATSWKENRRAFYYNHKVNCMPALGEVIIGNETFKFEPEDSFGVLDWGRGYWTYRNRWFWGSASGLYEGVPIGWNLGYGFSDRTPASENMIFYNGRAITRRDRISYRSGELSGSMENHQQRRALRDEISSLCLTAIANSRF